jgi:hypothetical protein
MPTPNGGETKSSAGDSALRLDKFLDEFERTCGIPAVGEDEVTTEARRLLALPPSVLSKMTPEQRGEAAYVLFQFSFRLQQLTNREQARANWADESVKKMISKKVGLCKGSSFEERRLQAVAADKEAWAMDDVRARSKLKADRVAYLSNKADAMGRAMLALQQARRSGD